MYSARIGTCDFVAQERARGRRRGEGALGPGGIPVLTSGVRKVSVLRLVFLLVMLLVRWLPTSPVLHSRKTRSDLLQIRRAER